jgi:hypothetical protein
MRLGELQQIFRDALTTPDSHGDLVMRAAVAVRNTPGLEAAEHVRIYRRAVLGTLTRALGDIYPVCCRLAGQRFFESMARAYVHQTPSQSPDLGDYGKSFSQFIADFSPAQSLPYLSDVARLEWLWHRAFHAQDEAPLDSSAVSDIPEAAQASVIFRLPRSAALLASGYPVHRIWQVNQPDWHGGSTVHLDEGAACLIIWRQGYDVRIDPLDEARWWFLTEVARGATLAEIAAQERAAQLPTVLPDCVAHGWIAGFRYAAS